MLSPSRLSEERSVAAIFIMIDLDFGVRTGNKPNHVASLAPSYTR